MNIVLKKCTTWGQEVSDSLIRLILYTLNNQKILWSDQYYTLNQGIPTGAKHSVPLANIFLSFIFINSLDSNRSFKLMFDNNIELWCRFIDDGSGIYNGNVHDFLKWFILLNKCFSKYDLDLTCDTDSHIISNHSVIAEKEEKVLNFLDIDIFKDEGMIHTREHRKSTSVNKYLCGTSAHPRHTFPGIVKGQLNRLRRLCSRDSDFKEAILGLEQRCKHSGYHNRVVTDILNSADSLTRDLLVVRTPQVNNELNVRFVTLAGSSYVSKFIDFAKRMNLILSNSNTRINIVQCTSSSLSQLLFNNGNGSGNVYFPEDDGCVACRYDMRNNTGVVKSNVTGNSFKVDSSLNCSNGGIYVVDTTCAAQYTGKTIHFGIRANEHFTQGNTAIFPHIQNCNVCENANNFVWTLVENHLKRGKYSLSEREYLWNNVSGVV